MKKRLGYGLVLALVGSSLLMSACSDDDSSGTEGNGGGAGDSGETGGSTSGGSSNKAGTNSGGKAGSNTGGTAAGGAAPNGGAADGGMGGVNDGGAGSSGGAAGSDAGAAGAGGVGETPLLYACGSDTQYKKVCSAKVAADCPDPTECSDCVTQVTDELEGSKTDCPACDDLLVDYYQCGVDAFESGNAAAGMQCIDTVGADFSDECSEFFFDFYDCNTYLGDNACPGTWPPT